MNADKIILPGFLIADLYKGCLVEADTYSNDQKPRAAEIVPSKAATTDYVTDKIKYYGENLKHVTIVVNDPDTIYLNTENLYFLTGILKACQLSIADIAIVNRAKQPVTYTEIKEQLGALQIILFDTSPSFIKLPFVIPLFQVQKHAGSTIMLAPSLSALNKPDQEGKILKTKLWNSLKQVFNV